MKSWWAVAFGVVLGLLSAGVILLASQPPRGNPITLLPPPTTNPIQVHISGEVQNPGVYALPIGSRVRDAVEIAGGFTDNANKTAINLARPLEDGARVEIPTKIQVEDPVSYSGSQTNEDENPSKLDDSIAKSPTKLININSANQEELETLSGIGPVTAQKIIAFREEYGPYLLIEEIQKVSGIGPVTFENIKDYITVDEQP